MVLGGLCCESAAQIMRAVCAGAAALPKLSTFCRSGSEADRSAVADDFHLCMGVLDLDAAAPGAEPQS